MGVKLVWYLEQRIIFTYVWGDFTITELREGAAQGAKYVQMGTAPVHDIIDMREMERYPFNLKEIIDATPIFREPNLGWVVLLSNNRAVNFIATIVLQFSSAKLRIASNENEALDFLRGADGTLPDPLPPFVLPSR